MKTISTIIPPLSQSLQGCLLINFDVKETESGFEFNQIKVSEEPTYSEIVEAIITSEYTTGREFACINNKEERPAEYETYQQFRNKAKEIAKDVVKI